MEKLTTATTADFLKNIEKEIILNPPAGCAAIDGILQLENCELISIKDNLQNKDLHFNTDKKELIVFGFNQDVLGPNFLTIVVKVTNNLPAEVRIIDIVGATPQATPVEVESFSLKLYSKYDINSDGDFNTQDVLDAIKQLRGKLTIVDVQKVINELIASTQ